MIQIPFLLTECLFALGWLLLRAAVWLRQKRIDWKREAMLLLMYVNLAVILRFAFFPMARVDGRVQPLLFDASAVRPFRLNLLPFVKLKFYSSRRNLLLNVIGNVAMFIPSGIILPILYRKLDRLWKVLGVGALMSLGIEFLQLPFSVRATDVDDLIQNICGVLIGWGIYALVRRCLGRGKASRPDGAAPEGESP